MNVSLPARFAVSIAAALGLASQAAAVTVQSVTGRFTADDNTFATTFSLTGTVDQIVTIRTLGYAGGTNLNGVMVPAGGFDPIVSLFSAAGTLIGFNDDGGGVPVHSLTGRAADSLLEITLAVGTYQAVLTQYDNVPNGNLGEGFSRAGQGNFTPQLANCGATQFCDPYGNARNGGWALDISAVAIPEPSSVALLGLGLLAFGGLYRRRRVR